MNVSLNFVEYFGRNFVEQRCLRSAIIKFFEQRSLEKFLNNDAYENFKQRCLGKALGVFTETVDMLRKLAFFITFFGFRQMAIANVNLSPICQGSPPMRFNYRDDTALGQNSRLSGRA